MSVRENYGVNVVRLNLFRFQVLEESSGVGAQTIGSRIYQHSMLTCVDYQTDVRTYPLCPLFWL
jgi:hypothetical protein